MEWVVVTRETAAERWAPTVVLVAQWPRAFAAGVLAVAVLVVAVLAAGVSTAARPEYARHGVAGVDAYAPSTAVACGGGARSDADGVTPRLRAAARDEPARPCVCAPELGVRRRALAVRYGADVHVFYNAREDTAWDGRVNATLVLARADEEAREYETTLFPERTGGTLVRRRLPARVLVEDAACHSRAYIGADAAARCVLRCVALFDGRPLE